MRVRFAKSTGCPFGQFVIEVESKEDEALLACFLSAPHDEWKFHMHGVCYGHYSPGSMNFGWINKAYAAQMKRELSWHGRFLRKLKDLSKYQINVSITRGE